MNMLGRKSLCIAAIACFTIFSITARADYSTKCASRNDLSGPCYWVHGRLNAWNGAPAERIWVIGTKRILGLSTPYAKGNSKGGGQMVMPTAIRDQLLSFETRIYADYQVCPFDKFVSGHMQNVCVEAAKNIWVEQLVIVKGQDRTTMAHIPDTQSQ